MATGTDTHVHPTGVLTREETIWDHTDRDRRPTSQGGGVSWVVVMVYQRLIDAHVLLFKTEIRQVGE